MREGFWLLAATACAGALFGCTEYAPRAAEVSERDLEVIVPTEVAVLDPRFSTRALDVKLTRLSHAGLIGLDPSTLEPVPAVARAWAYADTRTLDVELRAGLRFHDGAPLTPEDVCATLDALRDPSLGSPHRSIVSAVGECQVSGQLAVRIVLRAPRATLLTDLEVPILRAREARLPPQPEGRLAGLGPYRVSEVGSGFVRLLPADTGLMSRPKHALVVRTIRDENARALRMLAGRADIAPSAFSPALLPALESVAELDLTTRPGANVTYLVVQNDREPFRRVEVRRALSQAIDRERLIATLLAGRARAARWLLPSGHWATPAELAPLKTDINAARGVLAPLRPVTLLTSADRSRVTLARAVAQMLGDAGLRVRTTPLDFGVLLERLDAGDFDLALLQIPELTEPNLLAWFFHRAGVPGEGGAGRNRARYRSAHASALLDEASRLAERPARARAYAELADVMLADMPVVPLWHEDHVAVVSARARSFVPSAEGRWASIAGVP